MVGLYKIFVLINFPEVVHKIKLANSFGQISANNIISESVICFKLYCIPVISEWRVKKIQAITK